MPIFRQGVQAPPPAELDNGHILLPLCGQVPLELPCFDLMEYAVRHRTPPFFSEKFLSSQIQAILYQLSLAVQKKRLWSKRENRTALQILQYIDNNKGRQLRNQDYAAAFGKTYHRLNTIFHTVYGVTIKQMQVILRVEQAKRMLRSGHTISETSAACGFEDYFYFLKVFKSKTGMTPSPSIRRPIPLPIDRAGTPSTKWRSPFLFGNRETRLRRLPV